MDLIERFNTLIGKISGDYSYLIAVAVSVIAFAVLYYYLIKFLLDNQSGEIVVLLFLVSIITGGILLFNKDVSGVILLIVPAVFVIVIVNLYSVEFKRIIWTRRNMKLMDVKRAESAVFDEEKVKKSITEIIKALQDMSKNDVGAIIVLSNNNIPSQILESGVNLDSDISSELVESVFFPKTPLHDGAMIISGTKIVSAGCFLPLSQNIENIPKDLGTRHRAGIGVTETFDVVSIIVSEETGIISIASAGKITRYADATLLRKTLEHYYWQDIK